VTDVCPWCGAHLVDRRPPRDGVEDLRVCSRGCGYWSALVFGIRTEKARTGAA
jgi:hypothetical protein